MVHYLVIGKPRIDLLKELWLKLLSGEIRSLKPFGDALHYSLMLARFTKDKKVAWEEEDFCNPPLAQERSQVLDLYFENLEIISVREGDGWKRIEAEYPLWPISVGLPERLGERPKTTKSMPHQQISDTISKDIYDRLTSMIFSLPNIKEELSIVSVEGSRALWVDENVQNTRREILIEGVEFAHVHPIYDGSLHVLLPSSWAREVVEKKWGEYHPLYAIGYFTNPFVMVYAPRNLDELIIVYEIVLISYLYAIGEKNNKAC
jgi:hypothetical protein